MKVHTTTVTEVTLDADAVEKVFKARLDQMCGGEELYLAEDGTAHWWEDTGHGSGITHDVQNPTAKQIHALRFKQALRDLERLAAKQEEERRRVEDHQRGKKKTTEQRKP